MATAVQVESIWNGLTDNSGQPLAAGKVYTYSAGTTTPVSLYTSSDKSTSATNPLILDGNGKAQVWADGRYKFVVKTAADVTLYTLDNLLYGFDDTTVLLGGISTGSANAQTVSVPATVESYSNGQRVTFIAGYTNTGTVTLQFNALSPISVVKGPTPSSLQAGDLIAGQLYSCTYYGGSFYLENSPTPADVQRSRAQLIASVAGINTITGTTTPALTGYEVGEVFRFRAASSNTAAATINISALGAKAIQYNGIALTGSEIQANQYYELVYDGTQFQLLNPTLVADVYATGVAGSDTITATVPAVAGAYTTGMKVWFQAAATNTGATTINLNGLGVKTVQLSGAALAGGEIVSGRWVEVVYDGTNFQLLNSSEHSAPRWGGTTGGTSTAFTIAPSPAIGAYATGQRFAFIAHVANGAAATLAVNGLTATTIQRQGTALVGNEFKANDIIEVVYNGTNFQIVNVSNAPLFLDRTNNRVGIGTTAPTDSLQLGAYSAITPSDSTGSAGTTYGFNHYYSSGSKAIATGARTVTVELGNNGGILKSTTGTQTAGAALTTMNTYLQWGGFNDNVVVSTANTERYRVDSSGNLLFNTTSTGLTTAGLHMFPQATTYNPAVRFIKTFSGSSNVLLNYHNGTYVGGVDMSNTATSFPTSSDYRLKENITNLQGGLARVDSLRPVRFNFIAEPETFVDGFIAHEVADVVPNAVFGEKDAVHPDGTPKIQALDHSKLVPLLTAAIQELNTKVEALEARVAALEA